MSLSKNPKEVIEFQKAILSHHVWRSCLNCEEWEHVKEVCRKVEQRPPAKVIVVGCPAWIADIPF